MIKSGLEKIKNILSQFQGLGTYTREDGSVVPAMWFGDEPPLDFKVEGVEAIVRDYDIQASTLVNSYVRPTITYEIIFIQHDRGKSLFHIKEQSVRFFCPIYEQVNFINEPASNLVLGQFTVRLTTQNLVH